jgi:hypothetical protein
VTEKSKEEERNIARQLVAEVSILLEEARPDEVTVLPLYGEGRQLREGSGWTDAVSAPNLDVYTKVHV